ncbi:MAG TPA: 6-bladed beta-propeller, partial [Burkholderiales bacterium]|nr:6-bladed beta-propeller [Burkholderiales bacterium]
SDLIVAHDGSVYLADSQTNQILLIDSEGRLAKTIGQGGAGPGEFARPSSLVQLGDTLAVVDLGNGRLQFLSLTGEPLGTMSLPPGMAPPAVGSSLFFVSPTWGTDSVLAIIRGRDGSIRGRIGTIEGAPSNLIRLSELKAEIQEGRVPGIFMNTAQAAVGPAGTIWLTVPARASVERFDSMGVSQWSVVLEDSAFDGVRTHWIAMNAAAEMNQLLSLRYILDVQSVGGDLWVLLGQSLVGPATIRVIKADGSFGARITFTYVTGTGQFAVDVERRRVYFARPETAELLGASF